MPGADWKQELEDLIVDIVGDDEVLEDVDADLFEEGWLDSMAAIELLVGIEEQLGVRIAPTELDRQDMNTVNKIIERVGERIG